MTTPDRAGCSNQMSTAIDNKKSAINKSYIYFIKAIIDNILKLNCAAPIIFMCQSIGIIIKVVVQPAASTDQGVRY